MANKSNAKPTVNRKADIKAALRTASEKRKETRRMENEARHVANTDRISLGQEKPWEAARRNRRERRAAQFEK